MPSESMSSSREKRSDQSLNNRMQTYQKPEHPIHALSLRKRQNRQYET
jgi:hypothetical protein